LNVGPHRSHPVARGEDDDRQRIAAAAKPAQEIQPPPVGQVQIKQQRIIRYCEHRVLSRLQPFEPVDGVSRRSNVLLHGRTKVRFVFHQQHSHRPTHHQVWVQDKAEANLNASERRLQACVRKAR
jgi:hypothetical protein